MQWACWAFSWFLEMIFTFSGVQSCYLVTPSFLERLCGLRCPCPVPHPPCLLLPWLGLNSWQCSAGCEGLWCPDTGLGPVSPASKRGPELPGELEKHWQAAPPPGPGGAARPHSAAKACCLGGAGAWGGGSGGGGRARAAACLSAGAGAGSCVSGSLLPLPAAARPRARPSARPPGLPASRRRRPLPPRPGRLPAAQAGVRAVLTTSQVA